MIRMPAHGHISADATKDVVAPSHRCGVATSELWSRHSVEKRTTLGGYVRRGIEAKPGATTPADPRSANIRR